MSENTAGSGDLRGGKTTTHVMARSGGSFIPMCVIYVCTPNEIGYVAENVWHGVASVSRIDKIISLVCKRALLTRRYSAKETYNLIDPTDRSHPI